jgi:hypothetical protein
MSSTFAASRAAYRASVGSLRKDFRSDSHKLSQAIDAAKRARTRDIVALRKQSDASAPAILAEQQRADRLIGELSAQSRAKRVEDLQMKKEAARAFEAAKAVQQHQAKLEALREQSKTWITAENLDAAIEAALSDDVSYVAGFDYSKRKSLFSTTTA